MLNSNLPPDPTALPLDSFLIPEAGLVISKLKGVVVVVVVTVVVVVDPFDSTLV